MFKSGFTALLLVLPLAGAAQAQVPGQRWVAVSTTAIAITGDIELGSDQIIFSTGAKLALEPVVLALEGQWQLYGMSAPADIYRVNPPSDPKLLKGNTLCGVPVTYIGILRPSPEELTLNVYSGAEPPQGEDPDIDHLCASYTYQAG